MRSHLRFVCGAGVVQVQMTGSSAGYFSQDPRNTSSSSKDHRQVSWVSLAIRWIEIRGRAQRPCCDLQGALVVCFFLQEISQLGKGSVDAGQFKMFCQLVPSSCTLLFSQVRRVQFLMEVSQQQVRGMG